MCGIFCHVHRWSEAEKAAGYICKFDDDFDHCGLNNRRRGPDTPSPTFHGGDINEDWTGEFRGYVLWTQGPRVVDQPYRDITKNILLWNGDIFSGPLANSGKCDTEALYSALKASKDVIQTLKQIEGPFSFVYLEQSSELLYFGRDFIGRHSLLMKVVPHEKSLLISSVASKNLSNWFEVPALGIFVMDLKKNDLNLTLYPWQENPETINKLRERVSSAVDIEVKKTITSMPQPPAVASEPNPQNLSFVNVIHAAENVHAAMEYLLHEPDISARIIRLLDLLRESVKVRIQNKPNYCKNCIKLADKHQNCPHSKVGLLFSGGLDSTILAAIADEFVPENESIDLVNVAFETVKKITASQEVNKRNIPQTNKTFTRQDVNFDVPDRKTGRLALAELRRLFPSRSWNFVECNITQEELNECRSKWICHVVYPLRTVLDESLGCAVWFAARGTGTLLGEEKPYESPCRILLLGMGADELFGGYRRHRNSLKYKGWTALAEELDGGLARISERNLGRDNRVVSDHGKQPRLPYLDDNFIKYVTSLKPWERCCPLPQIPPGLGDKLLLRLLAFKIGLRETSKFQKRAFQFGSRIANSCENGSDISKWL